MGTNFFHLNSAGIYGPQNGKYKYYTNDKTNYTFVITINDNTQETVGIRLRGVNISYATSLEFQNK